MAGKLRFHVQMKGVGLLPETVRASDLAEFLTNLETAIVETAKAQQIPLAYELEDVLVSLVHIESGQSNDLTIAVAAPISTAVNTVSQAVAERRFDRLPFSVQESLHKISVQTVQKRWAYEFHPNEELRIAPAVISYVFQVPKPSQILTTEGDSTLWGNLFKLGGKVPSAVIRQRNGELLRATVTMALVHELQKFDLLYKDIGLIGKAKWRLPDWSLESFSATALADYRPDESTLVDTFRQLGEASGDRFSKVDDVSQYIDKMRSEEV